MPIDPIVLQRRHAELGRIRLGVKAPTSNGRTRPSKLDRYRFTSPHERHIRDLAQLYGGDPQPWDNAGKREFEVITDATAVPVIVVKGGISQWMETWSGGGCVHRCDGRHNVLTDEDCDPDDPRHRDAKPTTRLSVMLRDLAAIGVWRLESHGWNAAAELPGPVELAQYVGDLVPATLVLSERVSIKDGKTSRFVVPGLDLEVAPARLAALVSGQSDPGPAPAAAVGSTSQARAIEHQPARSDELTDCLADVGAADTEHDLRALWDRAKVTGAACAELSQAIAARLQEIRATAQAQPEAQAAAPTAATDEPPGWAQDDPTGITQHVAAPSNDTADPDALWDAIVREAGRLGWSTSHLTGEFEGYHAMPVRDADTTQLAEFLTHLKGQAVPA